MKKTVVLGVAMFALLLCGVGWAQTSTVPTESTAVTPVVASSGNSEAIARAFLSKDVTSYYGWLNFLRVSVAGGSQWVSGSFEMTKDGWISSLVIDGTIVPLPDGEPFAGLPINQAGSATQFSVSLSGVDAGGRYVVNGSFYTSLLSPGDPIVIVLHPNNEDRFIPYTVPAGVDPSNLRIRTQDGNIWTYDSTRDGFDLWVDPAYPSMTYEIFDVSTGAIYSRGVIDDNGIDGSAGENIISTTYAGVSAMLMDPLKFWDNIQSTTLDNSVERDGRFVPAKVVMARAYGQAITIQVNDLPGDGLVEVRAWTPFGQEMPVISSTLAVYVAPEDGGRGKAYAGGGYYYANLNTPVGYDRLVITITGTADGQPFDVYLSRGGGGKG
ncbi:MAG: hypothetical protein WC640_02450 [Candidatus Paceibacterota bacterium]|jgi:hypothetical protein